MQPDTAKALESAGMGRPECKQCNHIHDDCNTCSSQGYNLEGLMYVIEKEGYTTHCFKFKPNKIENIEKPWFYIGLGNREKGGISNWGEDKMEAIAQAILKLTNQ